MKHLCQTEGECLPFDQLDRQWQQIWGLTLSFLATVNGDAHDRIGLAVDSPHRARVRLGSGQTVEICPLSEFLIPSIYRIFRASQNAKRWCIINKMFAKSQPIPGSAPECRSGNVEKLSSTQAESAVA